jgi:peptidyl-dipeptidase Dcp
LRRPPNLAEESHLRTQTSTYVPPQAAPAAASTALLETWTGPYGGVPPFDRVAVEHFVPAFEAAMAEKLSEVERIAADLDAPDFRNTVEALEAAGRRFERVDAVYRVWSSALSTPDFQAVEREMAPRLAAFRDRITQNEALFRRLEAVYHSTEMDRLGPEQRRLAWHHHTEFVRAGASLERPAKARLGELNGEIAGLYTVFAQNVLADEAEHFLVLRAEAELAGLPDWARDATRAAAVERAMPDAWVVVNTRSAVEPFLTYSARRDLRERAWRMFVTRGEGPGVRDNRAVVARILALRAERAELLGHATHAHWQLETSMARTPERALELLEAVWCPAVERARVEVADMQALAREDGETATLEPWDYRFYAEKVRKVKHDLDHNEIKPYLQLDRLREAMFWVAERLFGLRFAPADDVPVYHPDVRVWAVSDAGTGRHVGLWYFDPYARPGKRSGAWMDEYRKQEAGVTPLVTNTSNFVRGRDDEPPLVSWGDARTLFHEFGHALHGLLSEVTYPSLSGTSVAQDYVEFPSQILEHWLTTPEVLERFAVHYHTGEPIPRELVDRITAAVNFNQGFATTEYLASALVDLQLHLAGAAPIDPEAFEREILEAAGMPPQIVMRHRTPHFQHVFTGDSYSAAYYSYLWADVVTADAYEAFTEAGGPYDLAVADRLRKHVLSAGNTVDPGEGYRAFRGRDPRIGALMRKRGFSDDAPAAPVSRGSGAGVG